MKTIFVVDDNKTNLAAAKMALDGTYMTYALPSAEKMFSLAEKIMPDLILLDIDMPEIDGFSAMRMLKAHSVLSSVPVVFLTSKDDMETELIGFEMGALDFISKPFSPPLLIRRIQTHIDIDALIKEGQRSLRNMHNTTINVIADMVECRDHLTGGHIDRTQNYLLVLLYELIRTDTYAEEISKLDLDIFIPSSQLHDVGKIKISDAILNKPGKLTEEEFEILKTHCVEGKLIIDRIMSKTQSDDFLLHAKKFAEFHHEKWDGSGYPAGLSGEDIPFEGRLMAIVDVYDALVSHRPYKMPFSHEHAMEIIRDGSGSHFDAKMVEAVLNVAEEFKILESISTG